MDALVICITRVNWPPSVDDVEMFEFNTETSRHKSKRASEFMKELLAVDNLDVSSDVETKHLLSCVDAVL